ncbi:MAG: RNA 2'-phosphotransferase [Ruminococcus sp.]
MDFDKIGKYLCFILRHHPEKIGITLDEHGWADVNELLAGISERCPLCREQLEEIVRTDAKSRYSFSADGQLIRCNQGYRFQQMNGKVRRRIMAWNGRTVFAGDFSGGLANEPAVCASVCHAGNCTDSRSVTESQWVVASEKCRGRHTTVGKWCLADGSSSAKYLEEMK